MKAIIMAGGFGTRLRPLTINIPKPMVPVGNLPMMEHVVNLLKKHGFDDIVSLLFFQSDAIMNYFKDGRKFGVHMDYLLPDQDFGTAGAVRYAADFCNEPVMVISGDVLTDFDLSAAYRFHQEREADATIRSASRGLIVGRAEGGSTGAGAAVATCVAGTSHV